MGKGRRRRARLKTGHRHGHASGLVVPMSPHHGSPLMTSPMLSGHVTPSLLGSGHRTPGSPRVNAGTTGSGSSHSSQFSSLFATQFPSPEASLYIPQGFKAHSSSGGHRRQGSYASAVKQAPDLPSPSYYPSLAASSSSHQHTATTHARPEIPRSAGPTGVSFGVGHGRAAVPMHYGGPRYHPPVASGLAAVPGPARAIVSLNQYFSPTMSAASGEPGYGEDEDDGTAPRAPPPSIQIPGSRFAVLSGRPECSPTLVSPVEPVLSPSHTLLDPTPGEVADADARGVPSSTFHVRNRFLVYCDTREVIRFKAALQRTSGEAPCCIRNRFEPQPPQNLEKMRGSFSSGARDIFDEPNAGGNSVNSEAISFEVLEAIFQATLFRTEMQVRYDAPCKIVDYVALIFGEPVGVSVTRAMKFHGGPTKFTEGDADYLLRKKLVGLQSATANCAASNRWRTGLLHIWCQSEFVADIVASVFEKLPRDLRGNSIVLLTSSSHIDHIIFKNSEHFDPPPPVPVYHPRRDEIQRARLRSLEEQMVLELLYGGRRR